MNSTPMGLVYWMHKEIQINKKKAKFSFLWLLSPVTAKVKVTGNVGLDHDAGPNSRVQSV